MSLKLTDQQEQAKREIINFLSDKQKIVYVLKGYAGTGKTTLVNHVLEPYAKKGYQVAVSSFTNKATNVIGRKTPFATAISLFRLLGLACIENSEKLYFQQLGTPKIGNYDIIVVDEVSMIPDQYLEKVIQKAKDKKLILMGDPIQLPPVSQHMDSMAFSNFPDTFELTHIVRQDAESDIPRYCKYIRYMVDDINKGYQVIPNCKTEFKPKTNDISFYNKVNPFLENMLNLFKSDEYKENSDYVKAIGYTNKMVNKINEVVRKHIYGKDVESIVLGEKFILNDPVTNNNGKFFHNIFDTSDEIEVVKIYSKEVFNFTKMGVNDHFNYYEVLVQRMYDEKEEVLNIVDPYHRQKFKMLLDSWVNEIKGLSKNQQKSYFSQEFYPFKRKFHTPSYNYAITSHKSQGSTYEHVFVTEDDINKTFGVKNKAKLQSKYVAFTRAAKSLHILNREKQKVMYKPSAMKS